MMMGVYCASPRMPVSPHMPTESVMTTVGSMRTPRRRSSVRVDAGCE